jgi:hypothetical protein
MIDSELQRYIHTEIVRYTRDIVLNALSKDSKVLTEGVDQLFPGMGPQDDRPLAHPYGFASKAPDGTLSVVLRQGDHVGNRMVIAHRDPARPVDIAQGESVQYSKGGYEVRVKNGKIEIGKGGTFETAVLGDTLQKILVAILDAIVEHTHLGNLGFPTSPPQNAAVFTQIETSQVQNGKFLAKDGGGF